MAVFALAVACMAFWLVGFVSSSPIIPPPLPLPQQEQQTGCAPFPNGSFIIDQYQLYPENAKFDPQRCVVYFGALFNASVAVFDLATQLIADIIVFPPFSGDSTLHLGPALPDLQGGLVVLFDAAAPFNTNGQDVSGSNILLKYNLTTNQILWQRNLTDLTRGVYGGYQDLALDKLGNIYIVGTFPGTVLRATPDGTSLTPWYLPPPAALANTTVAGFGGLASVAERDFILTNNNADGQIYRFDAVSSTLGEGVALPQLVPRTDAGVGLLLPQVASAPLGFSDAILLPQRYANTVLLVSVDAVGVAVVRSRDGLWTGAETLGTVVGIMEAESSSAGASVVATVEMAGRIFAVLEFFADPVVPGTLAGNRSAFPMVDITDAVDGLVARFP